MRGSSSASAAGDPRVTAAAAEPDADWGENSDDGRSYDSIDEQRELHEGDDDGESCDSSDEEYEQRQEEVLQQADDEDKWMRETIASISGEPVTTKEVTKMMNIENQLGLYLGVME